LKKVPQLVALVATLGLLTLGTAACGASQRNQETLDEAIRAYNEGVRWQRFSVAASNLPATERSAFVDEMDERSKDFRYSDYELVKVEPRGKAEARVQVKISWYLDSVGTLKETHAVQTWERHGKAWWMVDETRLRGDEMPGLVNGPDSPAKGASDDGPASGEPPAPDTAATMTRPAPVAAPR